MFQIIQDLIGNAVVSSGVSYEALCAILISSLFVIMIIGLVAGQELAFVLGGAGIIIGVIMLRLIFVALPLVGMDQNLQYAIKGGIILFACALDMRKYLVKK